jgi:hypothetical protein
MAVSITRSSVSLMRANRDIRACQEAMGERIDDSPSIWNIFDVFQPESVQARVLVGEQRKNRVF